MIKRLVVKVGTKVITKNDGRLHTRAIQGIVEQIAQLHDEGLEVILITSGAVGAGRKLLALDGQNIAQKQILASVGQVSLMSTYAKSFKRHDLVCAQVLVTKEDFRDKVHYFNMRTCLEGLIAGNVIPVVNENDVVAISELVFTDNDELTGLVASMMGADKVIILTSVPGVLTDAPGTQTSRVISRITIDELDMMQKHIRPEKSAFGRGGMLTKFGIAKKLALQGIATHIADGRKKEVLLDIVREKEVGTQFIPVQKANTVKRRIAYSEGWTKGSVTVNECAEEILCSRSTIASLLPVGITLVTGDFVKGEIIEIKNSAAKVIGFGVARYGAEALKSVLGKKNAQPFVHYDYLFISN